MVRAALLAALFIGRPAWGAQLAFVCSPFTPDAAEVAEVLGFVGLEVPRDARLESACFRTVLRQTGALELSTVRQSFYTFSWPTDEVVGGVRFHSKANCRREAADVPSCADAGRFASWMGSLAGFSTNMTSFELVEVLKATEELLGGGPAITQVARTYGSSSRQRFAGIRRYAVGSVESEGKYSYTLERRCSMTADCVWRITTVRRYYDPVY